jgi:hypothetical protein
VLSPYPVKQAIYKRPCIRYWYENENPHTLLCECKFVQPLLKTIWRFLKKLKVNPTMWPSNPITWYISNRNEISMSKSHPIPTTVWFRVVKQPNYLSITWWINNEDVVHIYNGMLLNNKTIEILSFTITWMKLEVSITTKI